MTDTIDSEVQLLATSPKVTLYELDATAIGGGIYRFCSAKQQANMVSWNGNLYPPMPIEAEGFEWSGKGALPTPRFRVSNVYWTLVGATIDLKDLVGATVTRIRTFEKFLADPSMIFPKDIYRIERKTAQNSLYIEWELAASIDQEGKMIPGRTVLRDFCQHTYRRWTGTAWDYSKASCPYTGTGTYTDKNAATTNKALDSCSRSMAGCKLRFGATAALPGLFFPGAGRIRV